MTIINKNYFRQKLLLGNSAFEFKVLNVKFWSVLKKIKLYLKLGQSDIMKIFKSKQNFTQKLPRHCKFQILLNNYR